MVQFNRFIINIALSLVSVNAIFHLLNNLPLDLPLLNDLSLDELPLNGLPLDGISLDSLPLDSLPLDGLPLNGLSLDMLPLPLPDHGHHGHRGHHGHHGHHHHHPGKAEEDHIRENIDFTFHENISEDESSR